MISIFNDDGSRIPFVYNHPAGLTLNEAIGGNPTHIYEVNAVMARDVFSGTTEPRATTDGTEVYASRKSSKLVRIDGVIRAPTFGQLADMNVALRRAFDPSLLSKLDTTGHGFSPFEFIVPSASGDQASYIITRPIATPDYMFDQYMGKNSIFRIELFCADPRRYLATASVHTFAGTESENINNNGNYPSIPQITITMAGAGNAGYSISNQLYTPDGNVTLNLGATVNGDVIVIYPNEKVVTKNGIRADNLVSASTNWGLEIMPGANMFNVVNGTNATTVVTAYHTFSL